MKYELYFKELKVASVAHSNSDFPNLSGRYSLALDLEKKNKLIHEYIVYSVQASIFMDEDEERWQEFMEEEEHKFFDLIECDDWKLISEKGELHPILIPNFIHNNEIVWRWNII